MCKVRGLMMGERSEQVRGHMFCMRKVCKSSQVWNKQVLW